MSYVNLTPDYSGVNPDYLVQNETHDFGANTTRRVLMPRRGAFFTESVQLHEVSSGRLLDEGVDYHFAEIEADATKVSGKKVCCYIVISNNEITNPIRLTQYQFVGGYFSLMPEILADVTAKLTDESNPVDFDVIVGKPTEGYTPSFHEHGEDNTFNWQYVVSNLERLRYALTVKHDSTHDLLESKVAQARSQIEVDLGSVSGLFDAHVLDYNDPHRITTAQMGVYTAAEIDAKLALKLDITGTAVDATLFAGRTLQQLTDDAKYQVPPANFTSGIFSPAALGPNSGGEVKILTTDGWKPLSDFVSTSSDTTWMGVSTLDAVKAALSASPVGTKASYLVHYQYATWKQVGRYSSNNFTTFRYGYYREVAQKADAANNWTIVGG